MKAVYTIDDLRHPARDADNVFLRDDRPARLAVIGDPIEHSKSPELHQPALEALDKNVSYIRVHLSESDFVEGVNLMRDLGFLGCNVTVPHKERALRWADDPDSFAEQIGVANTLLLSEGRCYSTDPVGLENALFERFDFSFEGKSVLILGAGGGAGSAVAQYLTSKPIRHLFLYNRTPEKLDDLYEKIISYGDVDLTKLSLYGNGEYPSTDEVDLIVNATSLGLRIDQPSPIAESFIQPHHVVYDMTYGCENALSKAAQAKGASYADGLSMLRHQGAAAFQLWFPGSDPLPLMGLK